MKYYEDMRRNKGQICTERLIDLAENANGEYIGLKDISARRELVNALEQIMPMLTKAGYVRSYRGNNGGYMLAKEPEEYTAGDIITYNGRRAFAPIACLDDVPNRARDRISVPHLSSGKDLRK